MMGNPTKFNNIESGATSSRPEPLSVEEINRLVNQQSLRQSDSAEFINDRPHSKEKPLETPALPLGR